MKHRKVFMLSTQIFLLGTSFADKVMPVFSDHWYQGASLSTVNNCGELFYKYTNEDNNKSSLISRLFSTLPPDPQCTWQPPKFVYFDKSVPQDFPTSQTDYSSIYNNPGAEKSEVWESDCIEEDGTVYISQQEEVYPTYSCPEATRVDVDIQKKENFCSTTPHVCEADILGRDLDSFGLGLLGHVGLATSGDIDTMDYGNYTIEVLNNSTVINIDTLQSFEHPSSGSYWGEVYGLPSLNFIDLLSASNAEQAGLDQRQFNPQYTLTTNWQEGKYQAVSVFDESQNAFEKQNAIIPAIFRCDTFVNYCYSKGFSVTLPLSLVILPKTTYDSFIHKRTDVPPQVAPSNDNYLKENSSSEYLLNTDLEALDQKTLTYLHNDQITKTEKLDLLWQKAKQNENDPAMFGYFVDTLSFFDANQLIPQFITQYNAEPSTENKQKLILAISQSVIIKNDQNNSITADNVILAQHFLKDKLATESNPTLLRSLIQNSLSVLPVDKNNYALIFSALNRLEKSGVPDLTFTKEQKYFILLSMAFSSKDTEKWAVPTLIKEERSSEDKVNFDNALLSLLYQIFPEKINPSVKIILQDYIKNITLINLGYPVPENAKKIYALATLASQTNEQKNNTLRLAILSESDPLEKAYLVRFFDDSIIMKFSAFQKESLKKQLESFLRKEGNIRKKTIYALAIEKVSK